MPITLRTLRYELIRTPLEGPAMALRDLLSVGRRLRHPELREIYQEDARIKQLLKRCLRPDSNCLDIGAHYGSMLSACLKHAPLGQHMAVEAIPEKLAFLRRKFPEVQLHGVALSSEAGSVDFHVDDRRSGFSGMARPEYLGDGFRKIVVPCDTLDHITSGAAHIDFVKIDVEGAEEIVLESGRNFVAEHKPLILFECAPSGPEAFGRTAADLYRLVTEELGYQIYLLKEFLRQGPPVELDSFEAALVYPFQAFNWVARARS